MYYLMKSLVTSSDIRHRASVLIDHCHNYLRLYLEGLACVYVGVIKDTVPCSVCGDDAITQFVEMNLCEVCVLYLGETSYAFSIVPDDNNGIYSHPPVDQVCTQLQKYRREAYTITAYLRMIGVVEHKFDAGTECAFCASRKTPINVYQWKLPQKPGGVNHCAVRSVCKRCHWQVTNTAGDIYRAAWALLVPGHIDIIADVRVYIRDYVRELLIADAVNVLALVDDDFIMPMIMTKTAMWLHG